MDRTLTLQSRLGGMAPPDQFARRRAGMGVARRAVGFRRGGLALPASGAKGAGGTGGGTLLPSGRAPLRTVARRWLLPAAALATTPDFSGWPLLPIPRPAPPLSGWPLCPIPRPALPLSGWPLCPIPRPAPSLSGWSLCPIPRPAPSLKRPLTFGSRSKAAKGAGGGDPAGIVQVAAGSPSGALPWTSWPSFPSSPSARSPGRAPAGPHAGSVAAAAGTPAIGKVIRRWSHGPKGWKRCWIHQGDPGVQPSGVDP